MRKLIQPGRPSDGVKILRFHEDRDLIHELVNIAFHTIQINFTKESSSSPAGTVGLTQVSTAIGNHVHKRIEREPLPWNMQVKLGDLFIEAFFNEGYVDIYEIRMKPDDEEDLKIQYIVSATTEWLKLADLPEMLEQMRLTGTHDEPPTRVIIKEDDTDYADRDLPWTRAVLRLQATGWRVNKRVLDAWKIHPKFDYDEPIEDNDAKEMKRRSKKVEKAFIETKATKLRDKDVFYQEVECDYRGRIYYSESFFNFQGSDLARGTMQFARAKPMTEDGLFWLAVHTASSYNRSYNIDEIPEYCEADYRAHLEREGLESISVDKWTLEDRVRWVNQEMDTLIEAGRLSYIFPEAEKPVSLLACCLEWYDYSEAVRANRIHMSHLPIPVDGSNNGWQHLGAMSKDHATGNLVGLIPKDIQSDFYVSTAKELYRLTEPGDLKDLLESMPMKHIRKGISKRGSMTRAYSAGAEKIGENMWFDCKSEDFHDTYGITEKDCGRLAKTLVKAINNVCPGPLSTMEYMQNLASYEIGKFEKIDSEGNPLTAEQTKMLDRRKELYKQEQKTDAELEELNDLTVACNKFTNRLIYGNGADRLIWNTPSGFKVDYECYTTVTRKCRGTISGLKPNQKTGSTVKHVARVPTKTPDVRGFMCGVSPNFVHSLDASHMALVIDDWHGEFGAVHDSFSTHACDVEELIHKTKHYFVEMYDQENFFDYIREQLTNNTDDVEQPALGDLDITEVYDSDYFFA